MMMNDDHDPQTCPRPECETCLARSQRESMVLLETALLEMELDPSYAPGEWVDMTVTVDWLDVRNVLDLLRH